MPANNSHICAKCGYTFYHDILKHWCRKCNKYYCDDCMAKHKDGQKTLDFS